jgi:CHASE1-domain containing sensor protein
MALPSPEHARGWLGMVLYVVERGGPITLLLTLLFAGLGIWGLTREVQRVHLVNSTLWSQLLEAQKAHLELAARCKTLDER